jgi:N-acetylglucosamine-6-sulfatase
MHVFILLATLLAFNATATSANPKPKSRPNIVFLLSDDQDRRLGSMEFMPVLQSEMVAKGVDFTNHYTTTAQCCPSRVTMMRGQYAHNTNVTNVAAPG